MLTARVAHTSADVTLGLVKVRGDLDIRKRGVGMPYISRCDTGVGKTQGRFRYWEQGMGMGL